eukprot:9479924-Pyramimonas_sp.AAC.1
MRPPVERRDTAEAEGRARHRSTSGTPPSAMGERLDSEAHTEEADLPRQRFPEGTTAQDLP